MSRLTTGSTARAARQFDSGAQMCIHYQSWNASGIRPRRPRTSEGIVCALPTRRFRSRTRWVSRSLIRIPWVNPDSSIWVQIPQVGF